ncbi:peptidoglycan DD-metalloendopeptidase family protein [Ulvibacterium marinum]|uniref:Peptidase M23 n=1 Tax=Ulvibacterium marinum TaxID=2419782 RepID=A0A3B0C6R5_9FLAO|nr:peptidoglycan DD-metalloendopeptidase family protein [Ulvibacterium marinum]RKN80074.1 peptidase M23 [Ulvibacterium marinum]
MHILEQTLNGISQLVAIMDAKIPVRAYTPIDLSTHNPDLEEVAVTDPDQCQAYIDQVLKQHSAAVAYGGYLEQRNLYADKSGFATQGKPPRNVHLGMDFWASAGTQVVTPLKGKVHSFQNNTTPGDYGPTIILVHEVKGMTFHTLYGHLSLESLEGLYKGKELQPGETLATLGTPDINGNYAPHLHFQIIQDLQNNQGDYPGVCSRTDLDFYSRNCPNPNLLLKL